MQRVTFAYIWELRHHTPVFVEKKNENLIFFYSKPANDIVLHTQSADF